MSPSQFRSILGLLLVPLARLSAADPPPSSPAINWVLPVFSDKEGYRILRASGSQAGGDSNQVLVTNLNITTFSGDASARVENIFLSPLATYYPKENRAAGNQSVRLVRDDLEATSTTWSYEHARKHVTLTGNVRIVFKAELKDLLK